MKVCIAEKPSVAQSIASILGANQRRQGYFEGNGFQVTWTFGHLCELKAPDEYTPQWKSWRLDALPMIPATFGISLKEDEGVKKQFAIITQLYAKAECIINCGDAGQEGELIQRWVMQKAGVLFDREKNEYIHADDRTPCPVYRLWISSLTDEAIREGFQHLEPQQKYDKLYAAGSSRAIGDWLLGMNATRLYTIKYAQRDQRQVISIGRVQTPTLALIVKRHWEIVNFQPQPYWELKTQYRDVTFNATKGRFEKIEEAQEALAAIEGQPFTVTDIQKKGGKEAPPRLYDLTSLQVDCNRKFGFSADETLRHIQSLYEKKLTTYPRVDTTFLSDDIYPKCPNTLRGLAAYQALTAPLLAPGFKLPKSKKVFDNSKVTDHHAIIPTGVLANNMTAQERLVYDLVARRFISVFYPDCTFNTTTVSGESGNVPFKATGKVIDKPGWRVVYADQQQQTPNPAPVQNSANNSDAEGGNSEDENIQGILPEFVKGESGPHVPSLLDKWTQPPKFYTEATLLRAMETAGKLCDDEELRDAMKENGLGRPSTRAAIIETLFKRRYIRKERKNLVATETGIQVIGIIREELLKSAELTGQWEKKLRQIERGEYASRDFLDELKQMVCKIVWEVSHDYTAARVQYVAEEEKGKKSKGKGKSDADTAKAASNISAETASTASGEPAKPKRTRKKAAPAATDANVSPAQTSATPSSPAVAAATSATAATSSSPTIAASSSTTVAASAPPSQPSSSQPYTLATLPKVCPQCGAPLIKGRTAFGCSNYANGCHFVIPFSDIEG